MIKIYANLLGTWTDITTEGTVADHQDPVLYFKQHLEYVNGSEEAEAFKYGYIHVQYGDRDYRLHPSAIQIVTE